MNQNRIAKLEAFGGTYHLLFSGEAMFELTPTGQNFSPKDFVNSLVADTPEGFDALVAAAHVLSEKGELARRAWGYDHGEFLTEDNMRRNAMPFDIIAMRNAVVQAVNLGLFREIPNTEKTERDIGLEKLNKKKEETY